jgi:predicted DNA-binding transcriptional regulator AlpA
MTPALSNLPESVIRKRLIDIDTAAQFISRSVPEIRRLVRIGQFPKPIKLNGRRLSWRLGELLDWIDTKAKKTT